MNTLETLWLVLVALYLLESYDYAAPEEAVLHEGLAGFQRSQGRLSFKHPFPGQRLFAFGGEHLSWDVEALRARVDEFNKATRWLRAISQVFFIVLYVVMPTLYFRLESRPHNFIAGVICSLILWWSASAALFYADRRLYRGAGLARVQRMLHAMIAPGYALRGTEALSRELLKSWHPLAAAAALMKRAEFEALLEVALLDENFRLEVSPRLSEIWLFGALNADERETWLRRQKVDLKSLLAEPVAAQSESQTYCPRCRSQFFLKAGKCSDCGLPLKLFKKSDI